MTREEFIRRVMELVETDRLGELDELYNEIISDRPEVVTSGGEKITVRWGTP